MSFENERLAIENRFEKFWIYTTVAWENVEFNTPNNEGWARLNILNGAGNYKGINNQIRHTGIIVIQIFVPRNTGTSTIRQYADYASSIFNGGKFNDVVCDVASIETIGADDIWHQVNVNIPYWRDE